MIMEKEFPALKERIGGRRMVYLDSACSALKMASSAEVYRDFLLKIGGCAGKRSSHALSAAAYERYEEARRFIAESVGAAPGEVIFTSGTTEAVNILASSLVFGRGRNEILISPLEHNSVFLPFWRLGKKGIARIRTIPLKGLFPDFEAFRRMLGKRTALVCVTRASNIFGSCVDVKKYADAAHECGARIFVDEAQYIPTHRENLKETGADFAAFSGHKMGAPYGTGVLYVRKELAGSLDISKLGGGVVRWIRKSGSGYECGFIGGNASFEAGIQNYAGAAALAESFRVLKNIGYSNIRKKMEKLVDYAYGKLSGFPEIEVIGTPEHLRKGSIISFVPGRGDFSLEDFNIFLNNYSRRHFIAIRTGRHCADLAVLSSGIKKTGRISFHVYTGTKDIDVFCRALEKYSSGD